MQTVITTDRQRDNILVVDDNDRVIYMCGLHYQFQLDIYRSQPDPVKMLAATKSGGVIPCALRKGNNMHISVFGKEAGRNGKVEFTPNYESWLNGGRQYYSFSPKELERMRQLTLMDYSHDEFEERAW